MLKTPMRMAKALSFYTKGYDVDVHSVLNGAVFSEDHDEMILVKVQEHSLRLARWNPAVLTAAAQDIQFHSLCEHHMVPFHGLVRTTGRKDPRRHKSSSLLP